MMKNTFSKISGKLISSFFQGLIFLVPAALTVYLLYWCIHTLDKLLDVDIPGLGLVLVIAGVTTIGYFGSWFLFKPFFQLLDSLMERAPVVKLIYGALKDFTGAFVGDKRRFTQPVAVEMSSTGIYKIGFVTSESMDILDDASLIAVYFPHSFNFSGNLFLVKRDKIQRLKGNATDIMKFVMTGGVTRIEEEKST